MNFINRVIVQTHKNREPIQLDNGPMDNNVQYAMNIQPPDSHIKVFHQSNVGVSVARNKSLELPQEGVHFFVIVMIPQKKI